MNLWTTSTRICLRDNDRPLHNGETSFCSCNVRAMASYEWARALICTHVYIYIRDAKTCLKALIQSFEVYLFKLFYVTLESPNSTSRIMLVFVFQVFSKYYQIPLIIFKERTSIEIKFKLTFIITIRVIIYHSFE